jgi:AraC-like DNA-binding protein
MVSFSIWPESKSNSYPVDEWRNDPDLVEMFGTCSRIWPTYVRGARMFYKSTPVGDFLLSGTAASSPLVYDTVPALSRSESERRFYLLMPNKPRYVENGGKRFVQRPGECMLADSSSRVVAGYREPHSGICLAIPVETLSERVPEPERFFSTPFGRDGFSRMVPRLLLSIWNAADAGTASTDGHKAAAALLGVLAQCCARVPPSAGVESKGVSCDQVKQRIDAHIRNPKLSVGSVARMIGVTTRYLQILFASEDDCVSQYIKRERLRGCLVDLRDEAFDDRSITDIAFSWGFNSAAHFSSSFRKEFGMSPRDYRSCALEELVVARQGGFERPLLEALQLVGRPG